MVLATAFPAHAQEDRGTITGRVTDVTGAVIPGVQVVAVNPSTGQVYKTKSNNVGIYNLLNLPIATYDITYSKEKFATYVQKGVAIQVEQKAQINVRLKVGSQKQTITVKSAPLLKLNTQIGTNMTSQEVTDLPLSAYQGRDITEFAFEVTPTVTGTDYNGQVGGSQNDTKEVLINGTSADSGQTGFIGAMEPPMDAVKQFQVDTSGISAAAGRTGGGEFQFELKTGSNHFHGTAFGIYSDSAMDANTWENDYFRSYYTANNPQNAAKYAKQYAKPTDTFRDWGVSGGFPIWRNRMFMYAAYEKYHQANFSTTQAGQTVPTPAFLSGDFSSLLQTNKNALGTDCNGNKVYPGAIWNPAMPGCVFPGNIIPPNMISSVSKKVAAIYSKYYQPTISGRNVLNYPKLNVVDPKYNQYQFSLNYTWDLTSNNRINSSFIYVQRPRYNAGLTSHDFLWEIGSQDGGPLTSGGIQTTISHAYRINDAWTITPNLLNVASFTFNQFQNKSVPLTSAAGNTNWAKQIGLGAYQSIPNFPIINYGGAFNGVGEAKVGSTATPHSGYVAYNGIFDDDVTWVHGKHVVHFGFEARALGMNNNNRGGGLTFDFNRNTGAPADKNYIDQRTGFSFANFLLGDVYSASKGTELSQYGRRKEFALYAEDAWRMTPKFTLDYALRWDIPLAEHEKYGHWSNFTTTAQNPNFGNYLGSMQYLTKGSQTFETHNNFHQFGPHIGASYALTNHIVVRGDYGIYYVPLGNDHYRAIPYGSSYGYAATNRVQQPAQQNGYAFNWDNGYPGQNVLPPRSNDSANIPYNPPSISPNSLTMGFTQNWNVNLQYQFARTWVLHVSYIGNTGNNLHDGSINPHNFPKWATYSKLYNTGHPTKFIKNAAQAAALGIPYPYPGWKGKAFQAILPYPQLAPYHGHIFFVNSPLGHTSFNAFVLQVTKRDYHGLSMSMSYKLSRLTGNTKNAFVSTYSFSKYYQRPYKYQYYGTFVEAGHSPQVLKGFITYELPFGHGQRFLNHNRLADLLVGGWKAGVILNFTSGAPLGAIRAQHEYPGWSNVFGNVAPNANFKNTFKKLDLINLSDPSNNFVDTSNFSNPPDGQLGNSPVAFDHWHGWASSNQNVSLMKQFKFGHHRRYVVTLRGEFFNVLNLHHYGNPNLKIGSRTFGKVHSIVGSPRHGQVAMRFRW